MAARILFFGATADATGSREVVINESGFLNVSSILDELRETYPRLAAIVYFFLLISNTPAATP